MWTCRYPRNRCIFIGETFFRWVLLKVLHIDEGNRRIFLENIDLEAWIYKKRKWRILKVKLSPWNFIHRTNFIDFFLSNQDHFIYLNMSSIQQTFIKTTFPIKEDSYTYIPTCFFFLTIHQQQYFQVWWLIICTKKLIFSDAFDVYFLKLR